MLADDPCPFADKRASVIMERVLELGQFGARGLPLGAFGPEQPSWTTGKHLLGVGIGDELARDLIGPARVLFDRGDQVPPGFLIAGYDPRPLVDHLALPLHDA